MKKKIAILGSTGSIGKTLIKIVKKDKKNLKIILLTTNKNWRLLLKQAKYFKVKNLIISDSKTFQLIKKKKIKNIKIYNNFYNLNKIFKKRIDYTMSSISGIDGLVPTVEMIKHTKQIAIANKEAIICGWYLIKRELNVYKTEFIPVDSEHYSVWFGLNCTDIEKIRSITLTASGGPFINTPSNELKNVTLSDALKHPNWQMGKKISIDSSTMMNKVFEVIEAKNIFDISYNKINILIHPHSYIHAILNYSNGMIKLISHDTTMEIPIFNSLYNDFSKKYKPNKINIPKLNDLKFTKIDKKNFVCLKVLNMLPKKHSLFETILVSINDELVNLFMRNIILYKDISFNLIKFLKLKEFQVYKRLEPKKIKDIIKLNRYVRFKVRNYLYK